MPIPGLKVLDELILGIPLNAQQRREIEELKKRIVALEKENEDLKGQLGQNAPKPDMAVDAVKILQYLFKQERGHSAQDFGQMFGLELGMAKYHVDVLLKKKLVNFQTVMMGQGPMTYKITSAGRAYIVENGLV